MMNGAHVVFLFSLLAFSLAAISVQDFPVRSFGTAIKNGGLTQTEQVLLNHTSSTGGVLTEMWMTGGNNGFASTRIRIYVDGETQPGIDYLLYLGHGIGFNDDSTWQGSEITGKNAHSGGLYNTYRIPFQKSIKITAALTVPGENIFWFIVRGLDNMPVVLGDLILPPGTRLKLYKNVNVTLAPLQYTTLVSSPNSGALFMVTIQAESPDLNYLEACFRAYIDGATTPIFLSSGTEDFFLSAYYFNGGQFTTSQSGFTHAEKDTKPTRLSMYKFFQRDPIIFQKGFKLVWRNFEDSACPSSSSRTKQTKESDQQKASPLVANVTYTSYVWVYEWTS